MVCITVFSISRGLDVHDLGSLCEVVRRVIDDILPNHEEDQRHTTDSEANNDLDLAPRLGTTPVEPEKDEDTEGDEEDDTDKVDPRDVAPEAGPYLPLEIFGDRWGQTFEACGWLGALGVIPDEDPHNYHGYCPDRKTEETVRKSDKVTLQENLLDTEHPSPIGLEQGTTKDWTDRITNRVQNHHDGALSIVVVQGGRVGKDNADNLETSKGHKGLDQK